MDASQATGDDRTVAAERVCVCIDGLHDCAQSVVLHTRHARVEAREAGEAHHTRGIIVEPTVRQPAARTLREHLARVAEQRMRRGHMAKAAAETMAKERHFTCEAIRVLREATDEPIYGSFRSAWSIEQPS